MKKKTFINCLLDAAANTMIIATGVSLGILAILPYVKIVQVDTEK